MKRGRGQRVDPDGKLDNMRMPWPDWYFETRMPSPGSALGWTHFQPKPAPYHYKKAEKHAEEPK